MAAKKKGAIAKREKPDLSLLGVDDVDLVKAREAADAAKAEEYADIKDDLGQSRINVKNFIDTVGADEMEVIIFHQHSSNAYWKAIKPEDGTSPDCQAPDGRTGHGDNGKEGGRTNAGSRPCTSCPWNKFGSGIGRGKKCKNSRVMWMHRLSPRDKTTPAIEMLQVPPTSLTDAAKYLEAYLAEDEDYFGYTTVIRVHDPPMGTLEFRRGEKLDKATADAMLALNFKHREDFAAFIEAAEGQSDEEIEEQD